VEHLGVEKSFSENCALAGLNGRMFPIKGDSHNVLTKMLINRDKFDFIYVDGSHSSVDCYTDCFLAWKLLNNGGVIAIDDYMYNYTDNSIPILKIKGDECLEHSPHQGVDNFLKKHTGEYQIIDISYRVFLEKL
jgi:predicted O-methyltransferase YrrM